MIGTQDYRPIARLAVFAAVAAAAAWAVSPFDGALVRAINPDGPGPWAPVLEFLHGVMPLIILGAGVLLGGARWVLGASPEGRRAGCLLAFGPFVANRVTSILKGIVGRPRPQAPEHGLEDLWILVKDADDRSFPSGHVTTATAFVIASMMAYPHWRHRRFLPLLIPLMMWDRIALAVHFPSDTLAGVGIGCASIALGAFALRWIDPRLPARGRPAIAMIALLLITWAWSGSTRAVDPVSMVEYEGLELKPRPLRQVLEPFVGPPLEIAFAPGPRRLLYDLLLWVLIAVAVLWFSPPHAWRRRRCVAAGVMVVIWGVGFWTGRLPADRFEAAPEGVFFDPHVHGSDPVDGARDVRFIVGRARERGVDVIALTNHDAPPPIPDALPGLEWSGGRHADETNLHLIILGGEGAFDAVMRFVVPPLSGAGEVTRRRALDAVKAAKDHGALVIVAHYWRTHAQMTREGTGHHLPSPEQLVAAGADGFEVANRHWEAGAEGRAFVERLDALCRERNLLRLACSDDHGIPAGSPCITFLPGRFPGDPVKRRAAVLDHLRDRGETMPVVWMREKRAERPSAIIAGPVFVIRYFTGLSFLGRVSWLLWFLLALRLMRGGAQGRG